MKPLLISVFTALLLSPTLFHGHHLAWAAPVPAAAALPAILVLVANGSDITINLPGENNHNRLLNVVSNSGNNNPSVFDWIGGNGANKAPRLSIGGGNQASNGAGTKGTAPLIDALWKLEERPTSPAKDEADDGGEGDSVESSEEQQLVNSVEGASTMKTSASENSSGTVSGTTPGTTVNPWQKKYVTVATASRV